MPAIPEPGPGQYVIETYKVGVYPSIMTAVLYVIKKEHEPHEKIYMRPDNKFLCLEKIDSLEAEFHPDEWLMTETILVQNLLKEWDMDFKYWVDRSIRAVGPKL